MGFYWLICGGPDAGAPIEEWEAYLEELLAGPDQDDEGVAVAIRMTRFEIALRKGEVEDSGNIVPPASGGQSWRESVASRGCGPARLGRSSARGLTAH